MSDGDRVEALESADAVPAETRIVSVLVSLLTLEGFAASGRREGVRAVA